MQSSPEIMKGKLMVMFYFVGVPTIVLLLYFLCLKFDILTIVIFIWLISYEVNLVKKCLLAVKDAKIRNSLYGNLNDYKETEEILNLDEDVEGE